jgi:hypothetical protein
MSRKYKREGGGKNIDNSRVCKDFCVSVLLTIDKEASPSDEILSFLIPFE